MKKRHCRAPIAFTACVILLASVVISVAGQSGAEWIDVMRAGTAEAWSQGREGLPGMGLAALPALIEAVSAAEAFIRWEAVNALGTLIAEAPLSFEPAIPILCERALADSDSHTRWRSLWPLAMYLAEQETERIIPTLRDGLHATDDQYR